MKTFKRTSLLLLMTLAIVSITTAQVKQKNTTIESKKSESSLSIRTTTERNVTETTVFNKTTLSGIVENQEMEMLNRDSWITWSDEPQEAVGAGNNSDFIVAQRFTPSDLTSFNGQYLSKMKFVPSTASCTYEMRIMVGGNGSNGYNSGTLVRSRMLETGELNIGQWNEIDVLPALQIDASQELWIAYRCISQTGNPAGCDLGPQVAGKGNLIYYDGSWEQISVLDPNITVNWCIQGYIETSAPSVSYPGQVTNLNITAGANQSLNATLTWTNPTLSADGSALNSLDSIIIIRNGEYWSSVTETTVGGNVTWTDNRIYESGYYVYTLIPVNEFGNGLFVKDTVAVGTFCETTVTMTDAWGDGWQGNSIQFKTLTGETVGHAILEEGASGSVTLSMPNVQLNCFWTIGAFPDDVAFVITDPRGNVVYNCPAGGAANLGGIFANYLNACSDNVPEAPANFTAEESNSNVNLSWINPALTTSGSPLTDLTNIVIKRNGKIIHIIENPTIGGNATWTDSTIPVGGEYEYSIVGNNQAGCGESATTNIVLGDVCNIMIHLFDSFGDGWYGNSAINIMKDGTLIGTAKLFSGSYDVDTIMVPLGTLDFVWVAGNNDSECAFIILDKNEIQLYASSGTPVAGSFFVYENTCADAEFATVSGVVTNTTTNEPIADAHMSFTGPMGTTTTTNAAGEYSVEAIVGQNYSVFVTAVDYASLTQTITISETSNVNNFELNPHTCQIPANLQTEVIDLQTVQLSWSNSATITLEAHNVWPDGSGYQMLLDPSANAYGTIFQEIGPLTTSGDAPQSVYDAFEYKIPENADGATTTSNVIIDGVISIDVPAGTYDFCITNPTANDRIWIASNECDPGRQNDFVFESGKHYHFMITESENSDCVILTISNITDRSVRSFNIYRDGIQIAANQSETTYTDEYNFVENQTYCYTVETVCSTGITSELSAEACALISLTSIDSEFAAQLNVYPNPVDNNVSVTGTSIESIKIFNVMGQIVEDIIVTSQDVQNINTSSYDNGVYVFQIVSTDGTTVNKRVIVKH